MSDNAIGIMIILGIFFLALLGGVTGTNGLLSPTNATPVQKQQSIAQQLQQTQTKVDYLQAQIQAEQDKKTQSLYKNIVTISYVNKSNDPTQEYITLHVAGTNTKIPITGWTIHSTNSGETVIIPKGTYLFFQNTINTEEDIYASSGDNIYIVTSTSPVGVNFKTNKCSGYLSQFQNFNPYLYTSCPLPIFEDMSKIPKIAVNDACFDYIQTFPSCTVETKNLPNSFSYECRQFIENTLNYPSCVNLHKSDGDFTGNEWRIFLKRSASIWKLKHENIILYDNQGKVVSTLTY